MAFQNFGSANIQTIPMFAKFPFENIAISSKNLPMNEMTDFRTVLTQNDDALQVRFAIAARSPSPFQRIRGRKNRDKIFFTPCFYFRFGKKGE